MAEPKMIEICQISPPPGSVPPTLLPLTSFDYPWLFCIPKRLFFFEHPQSTHHFTHTTLPRLKHSLSLALRHFFPFAADLVCPPPPLKPHLLFSPGGSVAFTVAQSDEDFNALVSNQPRDAAECHSFVPKLTPASSDVRPLLAIQVTVFPNSGFALGFTFNHAVADGRAFIHFVKTWSSFCRPTTAQAFEPPSHDRAAIADRYGLAPACSGDEAGSNDKGHNLENMVRATLVIGRAQVEKLKRWVSDRCNEEELHASSFVVTVAFTWVNLIRSQQETRSGEVDETHYLSFMADCRNRNRNVLEYPVPATYFGNCLAPCMVSMKTSQLAGENGVFVAAKAIGESVKELERGALRGAATWGSKFKEMSESGNLLTIAGSPNFGIYQTDFGLGKLLKSLAVHIDVNGAISLADCPEQGGGLEIGLALHKDKMNTFSASFQQSLKLL